MSSKFYPASQTEISTREKNLASATQTTKFKFENPLNPKPPKNRRQRDNYSVWFFRSTCSINLLALYPVFPRSIIGHASYCRGTVVWWLPRRNLILLGGRTQFSSLCLIHHYLHFWSYELCLTRLPVRRTLVEDIAFFCANRYSSPPLTRFRRVFCRHVNWPSFLPCLKSRLNNSRMRKNNTIDCSRSFNSNSYVATTVLCTKSYNYITLGDLW